VWRHKKSSPCVKRLRVRRRVTLRPTWQQRQFRRRTAVGKLDAIAAAKVSRLTQLLGDLPLPIVVEQRQPIDMPQVVDIVRKDIFPLVSFGTLAFQTIARVTGACMYGTLRITVRPQWPALDLLTLGYCVEINVARMTRNRIAVDLVDECREWGAKARKCYDGRFTCLAQDFAESSRLHSDRGRSLMRTIHHAGDGARLANRGQSYDSRVAFFHFQSKHDRGTISHQLVYRNNNHVGRRTSHINTLKCRKEHSSKRG
jgi:hypothetical protein